MGTKRAIVSAYTVAAYPRQCVDSILNQIFELMIPRLPRVLSQILGDGGLKELAHRVARKFRKY